MKTKLFLLAAILITFSSFAQKITSKKLFQYYPTFPEIPIPVDGFNYSIKVEGGSTDNLDEIAIEILNIPFSSYNVDAENTYSFEFIDETYTSNVERVGDSIIYNAAIHSKIGVKFLNSSKNYFYHITANPFYKKNVRGVDGVFETIETNTDAKERLAFSVANYNKYFKYNSNEAYVTKIDFEKMIKKKLKTKQDVLLLKKACNELVRKHNFERDADNFFYLGLKNYYAEKELKENLVAYLDTVKAFQKEHNKKIIWYKKDIEIARYDTLDLEQLTSIKFWKDKLNDSDPWLIAISAFNLSTAYAVQGDIPRAKKYFSLIKTVKDIEIDAQKVKKLNEFINSNALLYSMFFNARKEYIYSTPLEVRFEGNVSFAKGEVILTTLEQEEEREKLANAKADTEMLFEKVRIIDGVSGEVKLLEGEPLTGELKVLFHITSSEEDNYWGTKLNTVYVKLPNKKGVLKYKPFNVEKVDYFVVGRDKYYALDIQPSGSMTSGAPPASNVPMPRKLYHLEQVLETGAIYRDYSNSKMPYAIKLNHNDKVVIFEDYGRNDAEKRVSKLLSKCKGMKDFQTTYNGDISLKGMNEILKAHSANCTVH